MDLFEIGARIGRIEARLARLERRAARRPRWRWAEILEPLVKAAIILAAVLLLSALGLPELASQLFGP